MSKTDKFLTNDALIELIKETNITEERRQAFIKMVPNMDEQERKDLLELLTEFYIMDLEEEENNKKTEIFRDYLKTFDYDKMKERLAAI